MNLGAVGFLLVAVGIFSTAASFLRVYIEREHLAWLLASLTLYTVGNILIAQAMRSFGLGATVSASTFGTLIAINLVSLLVFGDKLSPHQIAGVALGLGAWVLIVFFPAK